MKNLMKNKHQLCIKNLSDKNQLRNKAYNNIYTGLSVWKSATEHYELVFTPTEEVHSIY